MITRNCVHRSSPNWVWVVKVHLQLIKFWPSRTLGKGVCGGAKIFGSALLQPSRSVCVSLSDFFNVKYFELLTFLQYFDIVCWTSAIPKVCEGKSEFKWRKLQQTLELHCAFVCVPFAVVCSVASRHNGCRWFVRWTSNSVGSKGSTSAQSRVQPDVYQSATDWSRYDSFHVLFLCHNDLNDLLSTVLCD